LGRWESRGDVIRHVTAESWRALPSGNVATVAIGVRGRESVVVPDVAIRAGHDFACRRQLMRACQRPPRHAVVKNRRRPGNRVVARRAVCRSERRSRRRVGRILCRLPGRQVAPRVSAVRRRNIQTVVAVDVAGGTAGHLASVGYQRVGIRQRKTESVVVELAVCPLRDGMARRASRSCRGKPGGDVIWHASAKGWRAVPCRQVAAHAVRGVQRVIVVDVAGRAGRWCGGRVCAG
jgi:hypothetical protein